MCRAFLSVRVACQERRAPWLSIVHVTAGHGASLRSGNLEGAAVKVRAGTELGVPPRWRSRLWPALHIDFGRLVELRVAAQRAFPGSGNLEDACSTFAGTEVGVPWRRRGRGRSLGLALDDQPYLGRLVELQPVQVGVGNSPAADPFAKALAEQSRHALLRDAHERGDFVLERDAPQADSGDAPVWILLAFRGRLRGLASGKDDGRRKQKKMAFFTIRIPRSREGI